MKTCYLLAVLGTIGSTAAFAAPRESVTYTNVLNYGRIEDPQSEIRTVTFNGTDGGAYTARYLTISGTLTRLSINTYFTEASVLVTPPSGTPFIIQPFKTTQTAVSGGPTVSVANTPAGSYTVPVSPLAPAGVWTFKFFERFNDIDGPDSRWDTVTISLNDAPPPAAAAIGPVGHTFTAVTVNGLTGAPGFDQTFTAPAGVNAVGVRIRAQGTGLYTPPATNTAVSPLNSVRVRVTPPGGSPTVATAVFPPYGPSSDIAEVIVPISAPTQSNAGPWRVEAFVSADGFVTYLQSLAVEMVPPTVPTAVNLGTLVANVPLSGTATVTATGQTKWFKFTLNDEISAFANVGLELDTEGSTTTDGTGALNTSMGLYTSGGDLVTSDYFDGTQSLGMLTFGIDNHPAPGDGQIYNGRDGGAVTPGDYYVAVTAGDAGVVYQPGVFAVANPSTQTGPVALHIRLVDPGATARFDTDAGVISGNADGTERATVSSVTLTVPNQVRWIKFTTQGDATTDTGAYLDIFTTTDSAAIDTEIGLYTYDGVRVANDDDNGVGLKSWLSFGAGGGPTVGDMDDGEAPLTSDGRSGWLTSGEYYLAVSSYNAAFGLTNWNVTTTGSDVGVVPVHFDSDIPALGACGPADIGSAGGFAGADGHLDNNDFIVFINHFFAQFPSADVGMAGGLPGSDGSWNNNDFIVFINQFFSAPASCH